MSRLILLGNASLNGVPHSRKPVILWNTRTRAKAWTENSPFQSAVQVCAVALHEAADNVVDPSWPMLQDFRTL